MRVTHCLGAVAVLTTIALWCGIPAKAQDRVAPQFQRVDTQPSDFSAQRRARLKGTPLRVYGRSGYLPPTAKRACNAWYEQEFRLSGTVIVPRMRCYWVNG